jgi:hypothetical protein
MLILTRRPGESVKIGDGVTVMFLGAVHLVIHCNRSADHPVGSTWQGSAITQSRTIRLTTFWPTPSLTRA